LLGALTPSSPPYVPFSICSPENLTRNPPNERGKHFDLVLPVRIQQFKVAEAAWFSSLTGCRVAFGRSAGPEF